VLISEEEAPYHGACWQPGTVVYHLPPEEQPPWGEVYMVHQQGPGAMLQYVVGLQLGMVMPGAQQQQLGMGPAGGPGAGTANGHRQQRFSRVMTANKGGPAATAGRMLSGGYYGSAAAGACPVRAAAGLRSGCAVRGAGAGRRAVRGAAWVPAVAPAALGRRWAGKPDMTPQQLKDGWPLSTEDGPAQSRSSFYIVVMLLPSQHVADSCTRGCGCSMDVDCTQSSHSPAAQLNLMNSALWLSWHPTAAAYTCF
jgi:hypothetical protein